MEFCFSALSLNVRGIRNSTKRELVYTWLNSKPVEIIFLQETHSTPASTALPTKYCY